MCRFYLITLFLLSSVWNSCQFIRVVRYNFADINDHKIFPSRLLDPSSEPFHFKETNKAQFPQVFTDSFGHSQNLLKYLEKNQTVAFLISYRDTLHLETYFHGYKRHSIVPSFSVAKSFTSLLVGIAIDQGFIKSVNIPVTKFVPEFEPAGFRDVTILHLLQATSGIKFNESYKNPFGQAASFYYGNNLRNELSKLKLELPPEEKFSYSSGGTQLLGLVLERAINGRSITSYLQENVWNTVGMEYSGSWSTDWSTNAIERTFCCLNAAAIDYAKLGRLYSHKGQWNGEQIVSSDWVNVSTQVDTSRGSDAKYQYQWWLPSEDGDFIAKGLLGQYIYVDPSRDLIIVRLGRSRGAVKSWPDLFRQLAKYYPKVGEI